MTIKYIRTSYCSAILGQSITQKFIHMSESTLIFLCCDTGSIRSLLFFFREFHIYTKMLGSWSYNSEKVTELNYNLYKSILLFFLQKENLVLNWFLIWFLTTKCNLIWLKKVLKLLGYLVSKQHRSLPKAPVCMAAIANGKKDPTSPTCWHPSITCFYNFDQSMNPPVSE